MRIPHILSVVGAIIIGVLILTGIVAGGNIPLKVIGIDNTVRQTCVALWAFLLPAWFTLDDYWCPDDADLVAVRSFRRNQQYAKIFWTILGGAVAIIIGQTAPSLDAVPAAKPVAASQGTQTGAPASQGK